MVNESEKIKIKKKEYSAEFKAEAVRIVTSGERRFSEVCRNLGISQSALSKWIRLSKKAEMKQGEPDVHELKAENKRLTEEVRKLRLEQELLKKAAAYFAKNLV